MASLLAPIRRFADRVLGRAPVADQELAISEDSMYRKWALFPYSPDKLIQRKRFEIFEEMAKDDQIAQCMSARKVMLLSQGWEIEPADESAQAQEQADFVEWALGDGMEGSFHDDLWELAGALEIGWALSEKVWAVAKDGEWAGKWKLKAIKSKNPKDFNLVRDDFDNLQPDGIVRITAPQTNQRFPASKFILYSYRKRYEDLFGTALIRSLYDLWWIKHVLKRAMGVYFERAGVPVTTAKYPLGYSEAEQAKLFQLVKAIRFESAAVIPASVDLAFTEPKGKPGEAMIEAIKHIDEQISKTILGQTLTQSQGDRGSQALGNIHKDVMVMYVEELARDMSLKVVRDQVIKDLIDFNFPAPLYPKFTFKAIAPEDETGRVDSLLAAADKGGVILTEKDEAEIRRILGFEEREEGDTPLAKVKSDLMPPPDPNLAPDSGPTDPNQADGGPGKPPKGEPAGRPDPKQAPDEKLQERLFTGVRRRSFSKAESRVDFAEVVATIESAGVDDIMAEVAPLLADAQLDMAAQVQRKKIIEGQDSKAIEEIAIRNLADIRAAIRDGLIRVARRGRKAANAELSAARKEMRMADPTDISRFLPKEVEKLFADRAFQVTGAIRDKVLGLVKNSLFASVKKGSDLREAIAGMKDVMEPFLRSGAVDPELAGGAQLETVVRTNVVDAFNTSRLETFKANGDFVLGLEYSAVLDDRVRENHAEMDGRQYAIDDPIWDKWTPPNGFNCRCVLVPITRADGDFEADKQPPASVQPDEGFK